MNSIAPQQQTPRPKVERRSRWKKRREFDRAIRSAAVGTPDDVVIERETYDEVKECTNTSENSGKPLLENLQRSKSKRQQSQKEVKQ